MESINVSFLLKNSKKKMSGEAPIYVRITLNSRRVEISTKLFALPEQWDRSRQEMRGRSELSRTVNHRLLSLRSKIYLEFNLLSEKYDPVDIQMLKDILNGKNVKTHYLLKVFADNNKLVKAEIGGKYSQSTSNQYENTLLRLAEFLEHEYGESDKDIKLLDLNFIRRFDIYLRTNHELKDSTVMKYLKQLKKVIHYAMELGYLDKDPFISFKTSSRSAERVHLTHDEVMKLENHKFRTKRLEQVCDVFLFVCYTGISYSDLKTLSSNNIQIGIDGKSKIVFQRQKTDVRSVIPVLTNAQHILDKYKDDPYCRVNNIPIPVISNQKLNEYLGEIEEVCEIKKHLTMHIGRHTFATLALSHGVPLETVQKMLGHTKIETTQIYAKIVDSKVSLDMAKMEQSLSRSDSLRKAQ